MAKTVVVTSRYTDRETAITLRDGQTASKAQYKAALTRLRAPVGDGLRMADRRTNADGSRVHPAIVVYDGNTEWALID